MKQDEDLYHKTIGNRRHNHRNMINVTVSKMKTLKILDDDDKTNDSDDNDHHDDLRARQRPSATELLSHPFLQVGTEIDDEPIYGDVELVAAAGKAAVAAAAAEEQQEEGALGAERTEGPGTPGANRLGTPPTLLPLLVTKTTSSSGVTSSLLSSSALKSGSGSAATSPSASAAVAAAAAAAASAAAEVPVVAVSGSRRSCFGFRRGPVTPTPLYVSHSASSATATTTALEAGKEYDLQRDRACAADFEGGGRREGAGGAAAGREWSSYARSPGYPPSCVSTESPSPSSPSAAPSFGGVPTTPSPPAARGFSYDAGSSRGRGAGTGPADAGAPTGVGGGGGGAVAPGAGGGFGGVEGWGGLSVRGRAGGIVGRTGSLPFLPPGVSAATLANATAIAARMGGSFSSNPPRQHQQHAFRAVGGGGRGVSTLSGGRNRSISYSDRQHILNAAGAGGAGGGGGGGGRGDRFGAGFLGGSFAEGGGGSGGGSGLGSTNGNMGAMAGRSRSASEDAVWDLLPSDESQCRRPFSVSAVEGRHGCL